MKVTTERLENCQVNVFVELDPAEVEERLRAAARSISRKFSVPGYRRGKAPYQAVLRFVGREMLQQEALEESGQELYDKALEQIEYKAFQPGSLKEVEWEPFRMTVLLPIEPELDLGDYRAVRVPFEVEPVPGERVEQRLQEIREEHAQWAPVERPAALGDQVLIDAAARAGGREVLKYESEERVLQGAPSEPLPGFDDQVVGLSAGEEKDLVLTYPGDFPDKGLAGQEAACTVRVHAVKQKELPPLDDELAMIVGTYDTLEELRGAALRNLEAEAEEKAKPAYLDKVLEAMVAQAAKIVFPPQALDREVEMALERMERKLASSGIKLDRFLRQIGKTRESWAQEIMPGAQQRLKKRLVMREVARLEGIGVADFEVDAEVQRLNALLGEDADELRQALASERGRLSLADDLLTGRAQECIVEIGRGGAPSTPKTEAGQADEPERQIASEEKAAGAPAAETPAEPAVEGTPDLG